MKLSYLLLLALVACKAPEGVEYTDPDRPEARAQGAPAGDPARELEALTLALVDGPSPEQACEAEQALPGHVDALRARRARDDVDAFRELEIAADRLAEQLAARCGGEDNGAAVGSFAMQLRERVARFR